MKVTRCDHTSSIKNGNPESIERVAQNSMLLILGVLLIISLLAAVTKTKWLPYPSSWLKALGLALPIWIGAVGVFNLMSWQFIFLYILAVVNRSPIPNIFLIFAAVTLIASLIWYLVLTLLLLTISAPPVARSA